MGTPAPRRPFSPTPLGGSGRRTARELAPWLVVSALVHVGAVALWIAQPVTRIRSEQPVPDWAIVLVSPPVSEEPPVDLPAAPAPRDEPPAPEAKVVMPSAPTTPSGIAPRPVVGPDGLVTTGERDPGLLSPGPLTLGARNRSAETLRPQRHDRRLYAPLPTEIVALSPEQVAQLDIKMMIADIQDSLDVMASAGRSATDWTYTDAKGRRWGVSPGQIHLGDLTIPLPFGFSVPVTADAARRAYQDADIAGHADRAAAQAVLKDRAAEIRRRRDAERTRSGSGAAPDTASAPPPREDPPKSVR